jgi:hypothetical protein
MGFFGYIWALQRMFHILMEAAAREPNQTTQRPGEAAVLLRIYIGKLNLAFVIGMIVYGIAKQAADWHSGLVLLLLCGVGGLIVATTWLQPRSQRMVVLMTAELERLRRFYRVVGNASRVRAVEGLLARLRLMAQEAK